MAALQRRNFLTTALRNLNQTRLFSVTSSTAQTFRKWYRDFWSPKQTNLPPYGHFTQVGDPVLRSPAAEVPAALIDSKEIQQVVEQMVQVLRKFNCVGVAAPQIGVSLRIIVMEFNNNKKKEIKPELYEARKMSTLPLTIFINPTMKIISYEKNKHPEGCMSVRGYSGEVARYDKVTVTGVDQMGTAAELQLSGWNARIAQHEMDHLNGKLYIDEMDRSTFTCTCWEAVNTKRGRVEIPFYK